MESSQLEVLVVDDNEIDLELLSDSVADSGYTVVQASDGREAWEKIENRDIRLVVTDWEMPEVDGVELCRRIRSSNQLGYVYVILLTANDRSEDIVRGLSAGADDFLTKPFNPPELAARLHNGERIVGLETRDVTIFALAKLAESRDPETGAHLERVRAFCEVLASAAAERQEYSAIINRNFARMVATTCPLHDIGKIGIPDTILLKPGRLSDEEFELMKTHSTIGGLTLDAALKQHPNAWFLRMARGIALYHHERYDGRGYPKGLVGQEIPLSARIVALADVYDALTSKRVYKDAFSHIVARNIIVDERGSQFDPDLVNMFLEHEKQFQHISEKFKDV